jgi:hypothetical protein
MRNEIEYNSYIKTELEQLRIKVLAYEGMFLTKDAPEDELK